MSLLPNYNPFFAATLGTIFARRWEPAPPYQGRKLLLSTPPIQNLAFWHLQIRPIGEVYVPTEWVTDYLNRNDDTNPPFLPSVAGDVTLPEYTIARNADSVTDLTGAGRTYASIFKVRLKWRDGGGTTRCIDFDLSSGVDLITPPAHFIEAELLVPVAGSELSVPPTMRTFPLGAAVALQCRADCISNGSTQRDKNVKFTDVVFFDRELAQNPEILIPRRKATTRFQASTSTDFGEISTRWDRNIPGATLDVFGRFNTGVFTAQLGDRNTDINDIPGGTNVIRYRFPDEVEQGTLSVVQELSY